MSVVTRSFMYKLFLEPYKSRDFTCTLSEECAPEDRVTVSTQLHAMCKSEVFKSVKDYKKKHAKKYED